MCPLLRSSTRRLVIATLLVLSSSSLAAEPQSFVVGPHSPPGTAEFWSQQRMDNANPTPLIEVTPPESRDRSLAVLLRPFTRYSVFPKTVAKKFLPHRAVGALFYRIGGLDSRCTATAIGNYAAITAAHCLYDGANFATDIVFVPGYTKGKRPPKNTWSAAYPLIAPEWLASRDLRYDYAAIIFHPNNGRTLEQAAGRVDFGWNASSENSWFILGYPALPPFDGKKQWICASGSAVPDVGHPLPRPIGLGCDMTGGSSGGPWIVDYRGGNLVNGVTSYTTTGVDAHSPYFDDLAAVRAACAILSSPADFACD